MRERAFLAQTLISSYTCSQNIIVLVNFNLAQSRTRFKRYSSLHRVYDGKETSTSRPIGYDSFIFLYLRFQKCLVSSVRLIHLRFGKSILQAILAYKYLQYLNLVTYVYFALILEEIRSTNSKNV